MAGEAVKNTMFGGSNALRKVVEDVAAPVAEFAVGSAPGLISELVEKKAVSIIGRQENKDRLLGMAESALAEKGLFVCLKDFVSWRELPAKLQGDEITKDIKEGKLELSPALEDELLDTLAGYLKSDEG